MTQQDEVMVEERDARSGIASGDTPHARVFLSYSRRDAISATRIRDLLVTDHFEVYLDTQDIAAGEAWQERLRHLIEAADVVVFLLSEDSLSSEVCAWELRTATELKKRVLPVVVTSIDVRQLPPGVARVNLLLLRDEAEYAEGYRRLQQAALVDIAWVRTHTGFGELALAWQRHGERDADLLRDETLARAVAWCASRPVGAPEISQLQQRFFESSQLAERRLMIRKRRVGMVLVSLIVALVGTAVWWLNEQSIREFTMWHLWQRPVIYSNQALLGRSTGERFVECAIGCPEMVIVRAGELHAPGVAESRLRRTLRLKHSIAVSRTELTWRAWKTCEVARACPSVQQPGEDTDDHPVRSVSWSDAKRFVAWLSRRSGQPYRLLTDDEWEYVARAGATTQFPWGDSIESGKANCLWCQPTARPGGDVSLLSTPIQSSRPLPVGSFSPNAFGLHDVVGNVAEWVEDIWTSDSARFPDEPDLGSGLALESRPYRMVRGGSWNDVEGDIELGVRGFGAESTRSGTIGLRIARDIGGP